MRYSFDKTATVARQWAARAALSEANRTLCLIVSAMAQSLREAEYVATEDLDSLVYLGCELCRRLGEAECLLQPDILPDDCPLGLTAAMALVSPAYHGLESGLLH
jgi:hypothetical protein